LRECARKAQAREGNERQLTLSRMTRDSRGDSEINENDRKAQTHWNGVPDVLFDDLSSQISTLNQTMKP
jgi:hypothetical protein